MKTKKVQPSKAIDTGTNNAISLLPTKKSIPNYTMDNMSILLYGPPKIGKSTWCSQIDNSLILATESGLNWLESYNIKISSWEDLLHALKLITTEEHKYTTIIIDTIDNAYKMCSDYMCKKMDVLHESDMSFGKGFAIVNNEFLRVLTKISLLPYGMILTSHSQEKDVNASFSKNVSKKYGTGQKNIKTIPTLPEKARQIVTGIVDFILFCDLETIQNEEGEMIEKRVLKTTNHPNFEAGGRFKISPDTMDLDYNEFKKNFINSISQKDNNKRTK